MGNFTDVSGTKINNWLVIKFIEFNKHGESTWEVKCDCNDGKIEYRTLSSIKRILNCKVCTKRNKLKKEIEEKIGKKYGKLTIVDYHGYRDDVVCTSPYWVATCNCGSDKRILGTFYDFKNERIISCGCSHEKIPDMTMIGQKFGRLTVVDYEDKINTYHHWNCTCECGTLNVISSTTMLRTGVKCSCGCLKVEVAKALGKSMLGTRKKYNTFIDNGDYYIGMTDNGQFLFDKEDYDKVLSINKYWKINNSNYVLCYLDDKEYQLHRYLMGLGRFNKNNQTIVDHKDGNRLDCRKKNLRVVHKKHNAKNCAKYSNNTSGVKGVHFNKRLQKWTASIQCDKKAKHLGVFENKQKAIEARKDAEIKYFGEFRRNL